MSSNGENFSSVCATRLEAERSRLDLSQAEAGALCGVSREIWGRYERGKAAPGGDVLFQFAAAGADVQYILTGARSAQAMSRDEVELIEAFRAAPLAVKAAAIGALQGGSAGATMKNTVKQSVSGTAGLVVGINNGEVDGKPGNSGGKRRG